MLEHSFFFHTLEHCTSIDPPPPPQPLPHQTKEAHAIASNL